MDLKMAALTSENFSEIVRVENPSLPNKNILQIYEKKATSETILKNVGVITPNGQLVGYGMFAAGPWDPILKPGYAEVSIKIDDEWHGKRIEGWILKEIEELALKNKTKVLQTQIQDINEAELEWARKEGFEISGHIFESQLDLSIIKTDSYSSLINELTSSGIKFTTLADYPPDPSIQERFWDLWWELAQDVPGMSDKPRPENEQMINLTKDYDKKGFILAVQGGEWVAMSMVLQEAAGTGYNSMTGVHPQYRGRGLAKAIKVKAIEYALQNGMKFLRTNNDSINEPMLAVNQRLGYEQKPGFYILTKRLDD
ncbi:GNAT family N-acetyltransferase [Bacillus sp. ISL-35]|uniref:GNAT family N-acetyltransferase n=1 Tax=Bacillus sp. ISL-35 TaxID=2819122 RepID=UPI001BEB6905|nr:GNAT family N-acetyltransferase [Bacillus sp. ISL-35]MBT2679410.1 GNAT family N-acetyltransferase [Bacillus sp. ISL-35]MBT2703311.1 GNAT family N-acetyltransferase [Chryseobacterium sp. ISL-80]